METPYKRGYQAGACYLPHTRNVEEEAYYASLSKAEQHEYNRGWLDGYGKGECEPEQAKRKERV